MVNEVHKTFEQTVENCFSEHTEYISAVKCMLWESEHTCEANN